MATIGLLTVPMAGHARPALRACSRLVAAGHRVLAWGPAAASGFLEGTGVEPRPSRRPEGSPFPFGAPGTAQSKTLPAVAASTAERAEANVEHVAEALLADSVDIVFHDAQAPWGRIAAEWLGLPRLCSFPLFPHTMPRGSGRPRARPAVDPELTARLAATREAVVKRWAVELGGFGDVLSNMGDATIAYTTPHVLGGRPQGDHWCLVGPLLGDVAAPRRRPGDVPRVYAALGTLYNRRPEPFLAIVEGVAADARLLISTGGGLGPDRLGTLPESVEAVRWVDPQQALGEADVHLTHGGGSSVHEALAAGVPMICAPLGSDQEHWARRVEALGTGVVVEDLSAGSVRAALHTILEDEAMFARAAEVAGHLADYDGDAQLLAAVERLAG